MSININYESYVNFYALGGTAWSCDIQILTTGDFNSFDVFWYTLYIQKMLKAVTKDI